MRCLFVWTSILAVTLIAPAAAVAQATQPASAAAVAVDTTTPKGALKSLAVAMDAGNAPAIRSLLLTTNASEEKMVGAMADVAANIAAMNKAITTRFGQEQAKQALGGDPAEMLKQSMLTIDAATEKVDGDTAIVSTPSQESMTLKKVGSGWKISVADLSRGSTPAAVDERVAALSAQMKAMQEVTAGVAAGKYATANDAVAAIRTRLGGPAQPPPATKP